MAAVASLVPSHAFRSPQAISEDDLLQAATRLAVERANAAQLLAIALSKPGTLDYTQLALPL